MSRPAPSRPARAVDRAVRWYQEALSPRKGWACAYRVAHDAESCSSAVRSIMRRRGVVRGTVPSVLQLAACFQAARLLSTTNVQGVCCCGGIPIPFRFRR